MKRTTGKNITFISLIILSFLCSACSDKYADGSRSAGIKKANGGALLGGIAGGVAGHQLGKGSGNTLATVGGVALGALAGHALGESMDDPIDKAQYSHANARPANSNILQDVLETGRSGENSAIGNFYGKTVQITPLNTYVNNLGQNCRAYRMAEVNGSMSSGNACRQADGYWR